MHVEYAAAEASTRGRTYRIAVVEGKAGLASHQEATPSAWTAADLETRPASGGRARHAARDVVDAVAVGFRGR